MVKTKIIISRVFRLVTSVEHRKKFRISMRNRTPELLIRWPDTLTQSRIKRYGELGH